MLTRKPEEEVDVERMPNLGLVELVQRPARHPEHEFRSEIADRERVIAERLPGCQNGRLSASRSAAAWWSSSSAHVSAGVACGRPAWWRAAAGR